MPKRLVRHLIALAAVLGLAGGAAGALAQGGGTAPSGLPPGQPPLNPLNPCANREQARHLRCPDLIMYRPYDLYYARYGSRIRLHAGNSIVNQGTGPMELFGRRTGPRSMSVTQRIHRVGGGIRAIKTVGHLFFKPVPGQGAYWKFRNAARFELWSIDASGRPLRRVRIGAKLIYCLRDLNKRLYNRFSPRTAHFPHCGQDPRSRTRTLGTSAGWSDDYPAPYPEQYIDVTGLRGRYAFFMVADPLNELFESNETNNRSPILYIDLPPGGRLPRDRSPSEPYP
jgi:hypothetical protein